MPAYCLFAMEGAIMKLALLSVTDKRGLVGFAARLQQLGYGLISTGGTLDALTAAGIQAQSVESLTNYPEAFDGRVKTLHPAIHGGILYRRDNPDDLQIKNELDIPSIDLVCVNLYAFKDTVAKGQPFQTVMEAIDIGGPTLIRGAAKNHAHVTVVTDPDDYNLVADLLEQEALTAEVRRSLAGKAFRLIADYDLAISSYFHPGEEAGLLLVKEKDLPYGENPHQRAALYRKEGVTAGLLDFRQLQGKALSYNNYNDAYAAMELLADFRDEPGFCGAIKHGTLCSAAVGATALEAYEKTYAGDPLSIFGGIVAFRGIVDRETAEELSKTFLEIILAPAYTKEAQDILKRKVNLRVLEYAALTFSSPQMIRDLDGKMLIQERDLEEHSTLDVVTDKEPSLQEMEDLLFANRIAKNMKSNAIVLVRDQAVLALSGGQTARIFALKSALLNHQGKDFKGAVMASDAFFPFPDTVDSAGEAGVAAIIQPGGSRNDGASISRCNELGISMVFTGRRHFKH